MSYQAFTIEFDEIKPRPLVDVMICEATEVEPSSIDTSKMRLVRALWDTGAGTSVISEATASILGLTSVGESEFGHAGGKSVHPRHFLHVVLPQNIVIPRLRVASMPISGCDILIGTDIISRGDFAQTNFQGKTVISFRIPSIGRIGFETSTARP